MNVSLTPYVVGAPVETAVFFGRQDVVAWLTTELKNTSTHSLLLYGPRAIGKTSLLHHLQTALATDGYRPVYFALAERPLDQLLDELAQQIIEQARLDLPLPESANDFRSQFLPEVQRALGRARLVLLLDNMDNLSGNHAFWKVVPLMVGEFPPALIFATSLSPNQLPSRLKSLVKGMPARRLGPLAAEAAVALLEQGGERLDFTEAAKGRILAWSGGHPQLLQVMGRHLWETAAEPIVVEPALVEETVMSLVEDAGGCFDLLWDSLDAAEQLYTAVLAQLHQPFATMDAATVTTALNAQAFRLRPHKLSWSVEDLTERGILSLTEAGQFCVTPPLFHAWIRQNKPVASVKEHLDRVLNPEADALFQQGRGLMFQGQYREAISVLRQVIGQNPYHVGAQLAVGASFLAVGSAEAAVKHLERAYKLDVTEAKSSLATALATLAETQLEADARNEALSSCEQFYKVGSDDAELNRRVRAVKTAVWNQRGDMALQRGFIDKALMAYQNAGNREKIAQLKNSPSKPPEAKKIPRPKEAQISPKVAESTENLEAQAKTLFQAEVWSEAAALYEKLLGLTQNVSRQAAYQKALAQCLEEIELAQHFDEGVKALENKNWLLARMSFTHVITRRMNYTRYGEKALTLLDQAVQGGASAQTAVDSYAPAPTTASEDKRLPEVMTKPEPPRVPEASVPDKARPAVISAEKQLVIDTVASFEQLACLGKGAIKKIAYSHDGQVIALATALGVYLYQTQPLTELLFIETKAPIHAIAFSPNNHMLATGSRQHKVQLWLVRDGQLVAELRSHDSSVEALAFSPDGNTLASADENGVIITWQVDSRQFLHSWEAHRGSITSLTFSPDGHNLLSGSEDKHFCLWQVDNEMSSLYVQKHNKAVLRVAFSSDGKRFFSASRDGTVTAWQLNTTGWLRLRRHSPKVSMLYSQPGHYHEVNDFVFSPDGKLVATASSDRVVRLWNAKNGDLVHEFSGHLSPVIAVSFSPDGQTLISATESAVQPWELSSRTPGQRIEGHMGPLQSAAVSGDGQLLATADHARVLILSSADLAVRHLLDEHNSTVYRLAFSSQNNLLASTSTDRTVRLWNAETGLIMRTLGVHEGAVIDASFSPDGQLLASASEAQAIRIWRVEDGEWLQTLLGHRDAVTSVCFDSTGDILASGSSDQTIHIWNVPEERLRQTLSGHKGIIWQVAFSADDRLLASASLDHTARLWQLENSVVLHKLDKHEGPVWSVQFSPDGQLLATGAGDNKIRLWYVPDGSLLRVLEGHTAQVSSVAFMPDGTKLISVSADGTIRVWGSTA